MNTSRATTLAALLRRYRRAAGLTQEELAERSRLSVRAVGDLERGVRRAPHKDTLELLVEALGLGDEDGALLREAAHWSRQPADTATSQLEPPGALPTGIPASLTPLIGREREEATVAHLLSRSDTRLLTLTGPAGIGKTRLAQQVAVDLRERFADGAVFVPLAPVSEHALVLPAIAQALGVHEQPGQATLDQLRAALAERDLLLILDNFEHVTGASPAIAALLAKCPNVKALVTSRTVLRVRGEQEFAVPPLDTPDLDHLPSLDDLAQYAAVALFMRRAQAVRPTFALLRENAPLIAAICVRLDGLPLAIELAAARIKLLSVQALLTRLETSLPILTRGAVDLPEHQQTMRSAIEWSYELLAEPERQFFRRLAVFVGGWTLEAAEMVCADLVPPRSSVLDQLAALVDKSLVVPGEGPDGEPRFRLLQLIREYGLECLAAAGEEEAVRRRHAEYFLAFAEQAEPHMHTDEQALWLKLLSQDHANLRGALQWAQKREAVELGLRLATALWWFWQVRGHSQEGREWLERFLAARRSADDESAMALRAEALRGAGNLAWYQGEFEPAIPLLEESLSLYRAVGNRFGEAHDLNTLGLIAEDQGQFDRAFLYFHHALALFRELKETNFVAMLLNNLALLAGERGEYAQAIALLRESLELSRVSGDKHLFASSLCNLGETMYVTGELTEAGALLEESLAHFRETDEKGRIANVLFVLGDLSRTQGDVQRSARLHCEGIARAREGGDKWALLNLLDGAADLACDLGLTAPAVRLFALSTKLRETYKMPRLPGIPARRESTITRVHAGLGDATFTALWLAGRAMSLEQAEALVAELEGVAITAR